MSNSARNGKKKFGGKWRFSAVPTFKTKKYVCVIKKLNVVRNVSVQTPPPFVIPKEIIRFSIISIDKIVKFFHLTFQIFYYSTKSVQCKCWGNFFQKKISWSQIIQKFIIQQQMVKNSAQDSGFWRFGRRFFAVP